MTQRVLGTLGLLILILAAFAAGLWGPSLVRGWTDKQATEWSMVTLDTNIIYVGRLETASGEYLTLTSAYVLSPNTAAEESDTEAPRYILTRLSDNEIYESVDPLRINREHVITVEQLKDGSELVQSLEDDLGSN